nr:putative carbohydrate binding domain containing protein [uncultured Mediterranean phage uvMED]
MSELKVNSIKGTGASTAAITIDSSSGGCSANLSNRQNRNLIINGNCLVNQRATTGQPINGYAYGVDRLRGFNNGSARYNLTQATVTDLAGFSKAYKLEVTTAQSTYSGTTISVGMETVLEGQDIAHLNFGTSNAKNIIVSFYVKSSVTGNFACAVFNGDSIDRVNAKDFTISSANTWERKTVTFVGDTGGTWKTGNTQGLYIALASAGSDSGYAVTTPGTWQGGGYRNRTTSSANIFATNGATMQFTGLQLEIDNGSGVATDFEHRSRGQELALCQRYYFSLKGDDDEHIAFGYAAGGGFCNFMLPYPVPMRAAPTYTGSATAARFYNNSQSADFNLSSLSFSNMDTNSVEPKHGAIYITTTSGMVTGNGGSLALNQDNGILEFSAEL